MARKQVCQLHCGRCGRDETLESDPGDRTMKVSIGGVELSYEDTCTQCFDLLKKTVEQVFKPLEKKSPVRDISAGKTTEKKVQEHADAKAQEAMKDAHAKAAPARPPGARG